MAQLPLVLVYHGPYKSPPFGGCTIYFHYGVSRFFLPYEWLDLKTVFESNFKNFSLKYLTSQDFHNVKGINITLAISWLPHHSHALILHKPPGDQQNSLPKTLEKLSKTHEPRKKPFYFPLYWLFNRDPYNIMCVFKYSVKRTWSSVTKKRIKAYHEIFRALEEFSWCQKREIMWVNCTWRMGSQDL